MKRKQLAAMILGLVLCAGTVLVSCGKDTENDPGDATNTKQAEETGKQNNNAKGSTDTAALKKELATMHAGDSFTMGTFEQDNKKKNGAEPISWTIIYQDVGKALVLSDKVLEYLPFQAAQKGEDKRGLYAVWTTSELRAHLNGEFYDNAFTADEKQMILPVKHTINYYYDGEKMGESEDRVFLLSAYEELRYAHQLGDFGYGIPTEAVLALDPILSNVSESPNIEKAIGWWLRDPGTSVLNALTVPGYDIKPESYGSEVAYERGVRPAMWIVYDQDLMEKYQRGEAAAPEDPELNKALSALEVGDEIELGVYDLNPYVNDGYEHLTWIALDKTDDAVLLITKSPFVSTYYMHPNEGNEDIKELNWAMSDLRADINADEFLDAVFTPQEKGRILVTHLSTAGSGDQWNRDGGPDTDDRLFLPDTADLEKYFPDVASRGVPDIDYWTRNPSFVVPYMRKVISNGEYRDSDEYAGVRLMMWMKTR